MTFDLVGAAAAAFLFIGAFVVLAVGALTVGVDSRPGIDEGAPHRWMAGS